jgi:hypothetical protein
MLAQIATLNETPRTQMTRIRPFASVNTLMCQQMRSFDKLSVTLIAGISTVIIMATDMSV